ncbi:hypothetical protein GCM10009776_04440 [Microbacterium deminutum]|uniref:GmrSD restriction endonucleases C-terminal domain-containing protein n=1 Tax=Microbacterium deminutum TaxID=344164 RepID=A0ABN2Q6I7_9MICO
MIVIAVALGTPRQESAPSPDAVSAGVAPTAATPSATSIRTPSGSPPATASVSDADAAIARLAMLEVVAGYSDARYDRDRFGETWADVDRNGCDTRNDTLGRDLLDPVFKPGTRDCKVLSGLLVDPYDGTHVDFVSGRNTSALVQIDHVVALAWAWRHGAESWTDAQRTAFANDPRNLVAASEEMNQAKSDSGPSEWLPPVAELRCGYVENFVDVLDAYDLGIDPADKDAAQAVLERC